MVILFLSTFAIKAQHVALQSHYIFNGVALNPAYTGSDDAFSLIGSFRTQWTGFDGAPTTQTFTAHAPMRDLTSSVGIQVYADQIGVDRETGVYGSYSYRFRTGQKSVLALGAAGGVSFIRGFYSQLAVVDGGDDLLNDSPLSVLPDFSFGAHFHTDKYFLSFSTPMFLSHELSGTDVKLTNDFSNYNFLFAGGYEFSINREFKIKPSVLARLRFDAKPQLDINTMVSFNPSFDFGLSYRTQEAIIGLFKFNANQQWSLIYSFGMPLNSIMAYTAGSHEISLKYSFMYKTKVSTPRFLGW